LYACTPSDYKLKVPAPLAEEENHAHTVPSSLMYVSMSLRDDKTNVDADSSFSLVGDVANTGKHLEVDYMWWMK
jgi:hypothetical protein